MSARFEHKNLEKVIKKTKETFSRIKSSNEAFNVIGGMGYRDVIDHFKTETDVGNKSWPKWRKGEKRYSTRPTKRGGNKLLQDTGLMRLSIYYRAYTRAAIIYSPVGYSIYHHDGTSKMARRRFMWIGKDTKNKMKSYLIGYYVGKH